MKTGAQKRGSGVFPFGKAQTVSINCIISLFGGTLMMKGEIIRQGAGLLVLSAQITGRVKSFPLKEYSRCFMVRRRPSPQLCTARLYRGIRTHSDTEADTPQGISYRRVPGGTQGSSDTRRPSQRHQSPLS